MGRDNNHSYLIIIFSLIILAGIFLAPSPEGLTVEGKNALGIFIVAIILWTTNALPLSVTGLFVIVLLPLLDVMSSKDAFSLFGNRAVFFILGAFILAAGMMKTGLSKRLALKMLSRFGGTPRNLLAGIMISSALMSFIMPEHAVAAIMFPVVSTIADNLDLEPLDSEYGTLLFLSLAWGAIIGGVGTLLGGARNPLAIAMLKENTGIEISFFEWCVAAIPIVFVMLVIGFVVLNYFFKVDVDDVKPAKRVLEKELNRIGSMDIYEKKSGAILVLTILSWIFLGHDFGLAAIAILGAVAIFILNVVNWEDIESDVNWGVILMYGGAISIGSALSQTGAAQWLANQALDSFVLTPILLMLGISLVAKFLTEGISNSAAVAILIPIGFSVGDVVGINPVAMVYLIAIPSGLAFMFPMGTPPNAIAYSSGYYEIKDVLVPGLILNLTSWIAFIIMALVYWPIIGLSIT
ncbi:anion transporter [Methanohalobium evestigatum Z-7303]|uniref:Anion transporter n=1 Tax=Methanohalobium evestigatum (strain ATCC BAA-1072 / DSM 3721 / NBRC 107634 / OCM 161 / Z-7303) TaxID=644295 RepID=D7E982_METEZ|nr:DASS family sodium-coupled anion symporter [Methanohalobium evestigatum]ADI74030.1 anion transporter [Methanohalobium evestigatum Z-7303]